MKGDQKARTPAEYLATLPEPRRTDLTGLHQLILKTVPGLKPTMAYGMIGYGKYHHKYTSGREGDWVTVALANQKDYIPLGMPRTPEILRAIFDAEWRRTVRADTHA